MSTTDFVITSGSKTSNWNPLANECKLSGLLLPTMTNTKLTIQIRKVIFPDAIYDATKADGTALEIVASQTKNLAYTAELLSSLSCFKDSEIRFVGSLAEADKRVILLVQNK